MLIPSPESETASIGETLELSASLTRLQLCGADRVTGVIIRDVAVECSGGEASSSIEKSPRTAGQLRNRRGVDWIAPRIRHCDDAAWIRSEEAAPSLNQAG
jgi:hypothetical protein